MKRLFLLFCLIPALLLCSCTQKQPTENRQDKDPQGTPGQDIIDEGKAIAELIDFELLSGIASEVVIAYSKGNFEDVEKYMLYSFDEQLAILFPGQTAPYEYEGYTFQSKEALADAVRSHLISGENPDFTVTVTNTDLLLYPGDYQYGFLGFDDDPIELDHFGQPVKNLRMAASIVTSFTIDNGEESSGTIYVNFILVGDEWKVFSPTICGYFLRLYQPTTPTN